MAALSDEEIEQRLPAVGEWRRGEGAEIVRDLKLDDFRAAVAFVNDVAEAAEAANHHPDILVHGWNKVRLTLSTHSEGGLTDADFKLAARIDELA
jgi:4a-hydroxytetrahydrobiopterin dehydratase